MAVTNLPINPSKSMATVGKDYLLFINTGTADVPIWTIIGGQRGSSLNRKADSIDVTDKTTGGWKAMLAGLLSWSIDLSGLVLLGDTGVQALELAFSLSQLVHLKFMYPNKFYRTGWAAITDLSIDNPHDGAATLKGTLDGNGPLSDMIPAPVTTITPTAITFSKAAPADAVFTVSPANTAITNVANGINVLQAGTDYTYVTGVLTIAQSYLAAQANGTITLALGGTSLMVAITVTD